MKICVLCGGGWIGMNTAAHLMAFDHEVFCVGRSQPKDECFTLGRKFDYHVCHIHHELDYVMKLLDEREPEIIINYAAQGEGAASFNPEDYWRFYETNCLALAKLVGQLQKRKWLKRFIHCGTSEIYGGVQKPAGENNRIIPSSPYAASKVAFDLHLMAIHRQAGFPMNILRPSNGYAPGQQLHRIVPLAIIRALSGRKLQLHGGGVARKSYLHGDDISAAMRAIMRKAPVGKIYNAGPLASTSIHDLVVLIAEACDVKFDDFVDIVPDRPGQDSQYWLDSGELVRDTGWEPSIGLKTGIKTMVEWVKSYPELLTMNASFRMRA